MECKVKDIMGLMETWAPRKLAENWDNPGLQAGNPDGKVSKILVSLDLTEANARWAAEHGVQMIVSHHPFFFHGMKSVDTTTERGRILSILLKHDISAFAAHTNLDTADGGVNDALAEALSLSDCEGFVPVTEETDGRETKSYTMGRIGHLPKEMSGREAVSYIKEKLKMAAVRSAGNLDRSVRKVAVLGGAGSEFAALAKEKGADLYLTGDVRYHEALDAAGMDLILVDGGHFPTERVIIPKLKAYLAEKAHEKKWDIEIIEDPTATDIFIYQ